MLSPLCSQHWECWGEKLFVSHHKSYDSISNPMGVCTSSTALTPRGVFCGVTVLSKPAPFLASTSPRLEWDPANPDAPQEFTVMKHQPMHSSQMTQTSLSPPDWIQKSV